MCPFTAPLPEPEEHGLLNLALSALRSVSISAYSSGAGRLLPTKLDGTITTCAFKKKEAASAAELCLLKARGAHCCHATSASFTCTVLLL